MILYENNKEQEIEGIEEVELQHVGRQLVDFVTAYRKLIRITTPDVERKLEILYDVGTKIINKQYHMLFNDPSVVIPNIRQMTLGEYQEDLFSRYDPPF